jgi:hypothetical protein
MPFNTLIMICPPPTGTTFRDAGGKVSMTPNSDEKVYFFDISEQEKANSFLREDWGMKNDEAICDGIIYYHKLEKGNLRRIICLVELKGTAIKHAIDQATHTHEILTTKLQASFKSKVRNPILNSIIWKTYIFQSSKAPSNWKPYEAQLISVFGKDNYSVSKSSDIGDFLRK